MNSINPKSWWFSPSSLLVFSNLHQENKKSQEVEVYLLTKMWKWGPQKNGVTPQNLYGYKVDHTRMTNPYGGLFHNLNYKDLIRYAINKLWTQWVKTHSKEPKALLYINHACFFSQNNFFIWMNFWMIWMQIVMKND